MTSVLKIAARLIALERGLILGALVMAGVAAALGVPIAFVLFALTLAGVALFHRHTFYVAIIGLAVVTLYSVEFAGFREGSGLAGLGAHMLHEWVVLANLGCLLLGFALLSNHFEESKVPAVLPHYLPDDWKGGLVLILIVFVLSSFLDNIAAAIIGGTIARVVFRHKVHIGYLAAIVAASNAGGCGSVVGDTTTTMMWIDGVDPLHVLDAYVAAIAAIMIFGVPASLQQQRHSPIIKEAKIEHRVDWSRVLIVLIILTAAIATNVVVNVKFGAISDSFPFIGAAVWVALIVTAAWRQPNWRLLPNAFKGAIFLLSLVTIASMMPVDKLPLASWHTAFGLGFVSSVFDNIPLTALALKQGGYDWGMLAYTVGFGGSMIWFGSSAGVALSNTFPEARSVGLWLRHGWHVALGYVVGFFVMLFLLGWHPDAPHKDRGVVTPSQGHSMPLRTG
ncbi:MAG: citrate transporter [Burkholderiales bacterium]